MVAENVLTTSLADILGGPAWREITESVFGMTDVLDVLVAAGARITSLEQAAATGDVSDWPLARFTRQSRIRALVFAADHQRLDVIDQLIEAGTPLNEADAEWGGCPCTQQRATAAPASVRRLLAHGADPNLRDPTHTAPRWRNSSRTGIPAAQPMTRSRPSSGPSP